MLMGLKRRNDFGEKDLAAAVGTALHVRGATKRYCADCGVKVAGGAAINSRGSQGSSAVPLVWRFLITRSTPYPPICLESPARHVMRYKE